MNATEAEYLLQENEVDPLIYSIGPPNQTQCHVLENENGFWITYNWERGLRHSIKSYSSETEAVDAFVEKVVRIASLNEGRIIKLS